MGVVVLTQPRPRVMALAEYLRAAGHHPIVCSFTELVPDHVELDRLRDTRWSDYERVLLTSPSAAEFLLEALGHRLPDGLRLAMVGPGSLQALRDGLAADAVVDAIHPARPPYDADALLALPELADLSGRQVMVLRGSRGRSDWIETLATRGARVDVRIIYSSQATDPGQQVREELRDLSQRSGQAVFVVTTSETAGSVDRWLEQAGIGAWARGQLALAVHPRIAGRLMEMGWQQVRVVPPGESALRAALESA